MYLYNRRKAFRGGGAGTSWPSAYDGDLVRYFRMEEASGDLYDEISATSYTTTSGATYQQTGIENYGIDFLSNKQCAHSNPLNGATSLAISFWAETTTVGGTSYFYYSNGTALRNVHIYHNATQIVVDTAGFNLFITKPANGWHHCVFLWNGGDSTAEFYVDGVLEDDAPASSNPSLITTAEYLSSASNGSRCVMDEFAVWKNVTFASGTEKQDFVDDLYNSGSGTFYA